MVCSKIKHGSFILFYAWGFVILVVDSVRLRTVVGQLGIELQMRLNLGYGLGSVKAFFLLTVKDI